MINFLILCRANIIRSPFIAGYLDHLYRSSSIADRVKLSFASAGTEGHTGVQADPRVREMARELGFSLEEHSSRHATLEDFGKANVILVTGKRQFRKISEYIPQFLAVTHHLSQFGRESKAEIRYLHDPGQNSGKDNFEEFRQTAISETKRIWAFIEERILAALATSGRVTPDLFRNREAERLPGIVRRYGGLRKRFVPVCPYCQSRRLRREKRKGFLQTRILSIFGGYPYHCGRCKEDFILFIGPDAFHAAGEEHRRKKKELLEQAWLKFMDEERRLREEEEMAKDGKHSEAPHGEFHEDMHEEFRQEQGAAQS